MNDDKRFLIAFVLSFLVLLVFYSPGKHKAMIKPTADKTTAQKVIDNQLSAKTTTSFEKLHPETIGPEEFYELANEIYSIKFSNRGAGISELTVKEWGKKKIGRTELIKPTGGSAAFVVDIPNETPSLANATFELEKVNSSNNTATFYFQIPNEIRITKKYELIEGKSAFRLKVRVENLSLKVKQVPLGLLSQINFGKAEGYDRDQIESFVAPAFGKVKVTKENKFAKNPITVHEKIAWQALTRKYFSVIVKPEKEAISSETRVSTNNEAIESMLLLAPEELAPGATYETNFLIFAGPEYYEELKSFNEGFEQTLTQGLWGAVRYYLFTSLRFCRQLTGNYGFAILLLTLVIKILFSPFTHMSFESMRKMQQIQPKVKSIQEQYKKDPARLNKETMELYRRYKVNPMGGCLPMLLQIPIFVAFYQVLAQMVELKGESLWWVKDLAAPDRLAKLPFAIPFLGADVNLLPLLMIGSMVWQQKITPQTATDPQQAFMMRWMPVIFGFFFYHLPSGLVLYWTLNNLLTIGHQILIHRNKPNLLPD